MKQPDAAETVTVSPARLLAMRAMYLLMAAGLAATVWPAIVSHDASMPRMSGVALALLGTIGLLALLGLRHPLRMLPLLLFELVWKLVWLGFFALPLWLGPGLDAATRGTVFETGLGLILLLVIPWRYVRRHFVMQPAERAR